MKDQPDLLKELLEDKTSYGETFFVPDGPVACRERLGGLLKYYYQDAA